MSEGSAAGVRVAPSVRPHLRCHEGERVHAVGRAQQPTHHRQAAAVQQQRHQQTDDPHVAVHGGGGREGQLQGNRRTSSHLRPMRLDTSCWATGSSFSQDIQPHPERELHPDTERLSQVSRRCHQPTFPKGQRGYDTIKGEHINTQYIRKEKEGRSWCSVVTVKLIFLI